MFFAKIIEANLERGEATFSVKPLNKCGDEFAFGQHEFDETHSHTNVNNVVL